MIDGLTQAWVTLFGVSALWAMNTGTPRGQRIGVLLGLAGQPAWWTQLTIHEQWLMAPAYLGYTGAWVFGLWRHWIKPKPEAER